MTWFKTFDSPDHGKVKSITHIRTVDATMYDKGFGFDSADIVATGPGRLDTQPDRGQPVDRTAIWQDKLEVQNEVDADGKIKQKIILLTGKRPVFMDNSRGSSIDSAKSIRVWLVPKTVLASKDAATVTDDQSPEVRVWVAVALTSNGCSPSGMSTCLRRQRQ